METILYVIGAVLVCVGISALLNKLGFKLKTPKKYEDYIKGEKGRSGKHLEYWAFLKDYNLA